MEIITIQVDAETAKAYRAAETQKQQDISLMFNLMVKELLNSSTSFDDLVKQIRTEAATNGLTPEILAELLEDE